MHFVSERPQDLNGAVGTAAVHDEHFVNKMDYRSQGLLNMLPLI